MTISQSSLPSANDNPSSSYASQPDTLYAQLKSAIEKRILSGEYPVGSKLPTEHELCQQYKMSRVTVRKALTLMEQQGLIRRIRGRGSFIQDPPASPPPIATPYISRKVELRGLFPRPFPRLWQSSWFQQEFQREFPAVELVITDEKSKDAPYSKRYNRLDLYTIAANEYTYLKQRELIDSWPEIMGEQRWKNLLADIPHDLVRYVGLDKIESLIPLSYSPIAFIYNPQLLEQANIPPPRFNWSEQEFFDVCEKLYAHKHSGKRFFPFFCNFSNHFRWPFALYREGGRVWSEDGLTCKLDSEESIRGIQFYKKMIYEKGWGRPYHGTLPNSDHILFFHGHVAIQLGSINTIQKLHDLGCKDLGILSVPEGRRHANLSTHCLLAASPHSRNPELIADFIEFIRRPDILKQQFQRWKMFNTSQRAMHEILTELPSDEYELVNAFLRLTPDINNIEYPASHEAANKLSQLIELLWIDLEHAETHCREIAAEINHMPELVELRKNQP